MNVYFSVKNKRFVENVLLQLLHLPFGNISFGQFWRDMKRTLAALLMPGLFSGVAMAQSFVQVRGNMDAGFIKESGSDVSMGSFMAPRFKFIGQEDLGDGLKATFLLEERFNINGTKSGNYRWDQNLRKSLGDSKPMLFNGEAVVGLAGPWGHVRLGRIHGIAVETFTTIDPFEQNGIVASFAVHNLVAHKYQSNSVRYDSPANKGLRFSATYSLGSDSHGDSDLARFIRKNGNDGFAALVKYAQGPVMLFGLASRQPDSNKSWLWDLGATVSFGDLKLYAGYEQTVFKALEGDYSIRTGDQKEFLGGLKYQMGQHFILSSIDWAKLESTRQDGHAMKYALGYGYDLSKRTRLYTNLVYIHSSNPYVGSLYNDNSRASDSMSGIQTGILHKF